MKAALLQWTTLLVTAYLSTHADARNREDYNRMAADRYTELFQWADRDRSDTVSRAEANGSVDLVASFNDIDIDRDGHVTRTELERYVFSRFSIRLDRPDERAQHGKPA
jgi:hypothetical protein